MGGGRATAGACHCRVTKTGDTIITRLDEVIALRFGRRRRVWTPFSLVEDRHDVRQGRKYEIAFGYKRDGMLLSQSHHPNINSSTLH